MAYTKEQSREYYLKTKEKRKADREKYKGMVWEPLHKFGDTAYLRKKKSFPMNTFMLKKNDAKKKGLEWSISFEWISDRILAGTCEMTGLPFIYARSHPFMPSIDRIDPESGYTEDNCRIVCYMYNMAKNRWTDANVLRMAEALVSRHKKN